jgi:hypothetical protein
MITIKEIKDFLSKLPEEMDSFSMVNGEVGYIPSEDGEEQAYYRVDKPIVTLYIDETSKELCLLHQTRDEAKDITGEDFDYENTEENKG